MGYDIATIREVYYVLASGGYLIRPKIERLEFSTADDDFDETSETFNEYVERSLIEARNENEQGFSQSFVIKEAGLPVWASLINVEVNKIDTGSRTGIIRPPI